MKKKLCIFFAVLVMCIALIYICNIDNLPENIILFEGEELNLRTIFGVDVKTSFSSNPNIERIENNQSITVSTNAEGEEQTGKLSLDVSFLGVKVKEINVDIIENAKVVPLRNNNWSKAIYTWGISSRNVRDNRRGFSKI